MKSEADLFLYSISLFTVFLPLNWSWIRSALRVIEKLDDFEHPTLWLLLLHLIPGTTMGLLWGLAGCSLSLFVEQKQYSLNKVLSVLFFILFVFSLAIIIFLIWSSMSIKRSRRHEAVE